MIYAAIFLLGAGLGAYLAVVGLFYMDKLDHDAINALQPGPTPADCAYLEP